MKLKNILKRTSIFTLFFFLAFSTFSTQVKAQENDMTRTADPYSIRPSGILADNRPTSTFITTNNPSSFHLQGSISFKIENIKPALYGRNLRAELWAVYSTYPSRALRIYDMYPEYKNTDVFSVRFTPSSSFVYVTLQSTPLTPGLNEFIPVIVDVATGEAIFTNTTANPNVQTRLQTTYTGYKTPLYKFWSGKSHFFTADPTMLGNAQLMKYWTYEGIAFYADKQSVDANSKPVYRFWSDQFQSHFFTLDNSMKNNPELMKYWKYEGVVYYATAQSGGSRPIYRFWNGTAKSHFFTLDNSMKDDPYLKQFWTYEGVAFYGYTAYN